MKFLFVFIFLNSIAQDFKKDKIYLLGTGNESKQIMIAKDFNIGHSYLTHIAIGFYENNSFTVYEINPDNGINSKINITNWENFKNNTSFYLGGWEFQSEVNLSNMLEKYIKHKIQINTTYNFNFNIDAKNQEYCSRFVVNALNSTNHLNFSPITITLNDKYKSIFKKETFTYYPVDFFINNKFFKSIYEKKQF